MNCNRLTGLIKNWYLQVQDETMAPARMVSFMQQHISTCEECLKDQGVKEEVDKIREIVLPPSKTPKPKTEKDDDDDPSSDDDPSGEDEKDESTDSDDDEIEDEEDIEIDPDLDD